MKIAVTYENGEVFQHFGKTQSFKIYEEEDGAVVSAEVIGTEGNGHEALADFLAGKGVDTVICGGLGQGAENALTEAGIEVVSGAEGDADAVVQAYIEGELASAGANCNHHSGEASGCGGGCGGCKGGCHSQPTIIGPNAGKTCTVQYIGTYNDGTEFDSSYKNGEPLEFVCGIGQMISGFDEAVAMMEVGQSIDIHLPPEKAYGQPDPKAFFSLPIKQLAGSEDLSVGDRIILYDDQGRSVPVCVTEKTDESLTFDANHELAGVDVNFHIELLSAE